MNADKIRNCIENLSFVSAFHRRLSAFIDV